MDQATHTARQTLQQVIDRVRLLADKDREALTALDAMLGALLEMQGNVQGRGILLAIMQTGADVPSMAAQTSADDAAKV
jgi:hypothetical protein